MFVNIMFMFLIASVYVFQVYVCVLQQQIEKHDIKLKNIDIELKHMNIHLNTQTVAFLTTYSQSSYSHIAFEHKRMQSDTLIMIW